MDPNQQQQTQQPQQLPTEVLAQVLQHVPLQQRLTDAALVCQQWAAAAGMATISIKHTPATAASLAGLSAWLMQHGQQLESLEVSRTYDTGIMQLQLQLPCAGLSQLSKLRVSSHLLQLQLPSTVRQPATRRSRRGSSTAPAALLPKLVELHASFWDLSSTSALLQLTSLSTLTHLHMEMISLSGSSHKQRLAQLSKAVSKVLQHLPLLQQLELQGMKLDASAFLPLASMQHLQICNIRCLLTAGAGTVHSIGLLDHLPISLTSLHLEDRRFFDGVFYATPTNMPWTSLLRQLTGLQTQCCNSVNFHGAMFANMPQATNLYFEDCELLGGVEGAAALLAAVQQMQQLEVLDFNWGTLDGLSDVPPQQFSALTASTRLRHLFLETESAELLPVGAAAHMFPRGRRLPALLSVGFKSDVGDCMTSADLRLLAEACPNLQFVGLQGVMEPGCSDALLDLPSCLDTLHLGDVFSDDAVDVVCQLTQLEHLYWYGSSTLTDAGLERLTALTRLISLGIMGCDGISEEVGDEDNKLELGEQEGKPVWQQLRAVCDESPVCAVARVKQLKEQNQQLQQRVAELEARVAQFEQGQQ